MVGTGRPDNTVPARTGRYRYLCADGTGYGEVSEPSAYTGTNSYILCTNNQFIATTLILACIVSIHDFIASQIII